MCIVRRDNLSVMEKAEGSGGGVEVMALLAGYSWLREAVDGAEGRAKTEEVCQCHEEHGG